MREHEIRADERLRILELFTKELGPYADYLISMKKLVEILVEERNTL